MKLILERSLPSPQTTIKVAEEFYAQYLQKHPAGTLFFRGGLGAGKTFLVRQLMALASDPSLVQSPTYTYAHQYPPHFWHFDCYRLDDAKFYEKGLNSLVESDHWYFVEWADHLSAETQALFPTPYFWLELKHGKSASSRHLKLWQKD